MTKLCEKCGQKVVVKGELAGKMAYWAGAKRSDNPFKVGSDEREGWYKGWELAQENS